MVIPTYRREEVLTNTLRDVIDLRPKPTEILVVDQTEAHGVETEARLLGWERSGDIRRILLARPSIPRALNVGLLQSRGAVVLFLDDDIVPSKELVLHHLIAHGIEGVAAVVGQVLQPGEQPVVASPPAPRDGFFADLDFPFNSTEHAFVKSAMAGNFSVSRKFALSIGGFDENFIGTAYRFETDFARRIWAAGAVVLFEPKASIRHLRAQGGGTREKGDHLTSASPLHHGVGDYYFALRHANSMTLWLYLLTRPFRYVRTKYHLRHPWWIPVKLLGEIRALGLAARLYREGPRYLCCDSNGGGVSKVASKYSTGGAGQR